MKIVANGMQLEVDVRGPANGQPLLLIMGLGMQLIAWPESLVSALVGHGFRVVRFDNRDIGLSQHLDELGMPRMAVAGLRYALRLPVRCPYSLRDMARDALGVLDALQIPQAHVCGASMGGMIAQHLAVEASGRVASLCLMMTTSGARYLPQPGWHVRRELMTRPMGPGADAAVEWAQRLFRVIGSPGFPMEPAQMRERALQSVQRAWHPAGSARQLLAIVADGDRTPWLGRITCRTGVIHGMDDPLVPVAAGRQLAQVIPGAQSDFIEGMGHDLPDALAPRFAAFVSRLAGRGC
jgi:pimeloyl-ACP methyl ester carboxylesterase